MPWSRLVVRREGTRRVYIYKEGTALMRNTPYHHHNLSWQRRPELTKKENNLC